MVPTTLDPHLLMLFFLIVGIDDLIYVAIAMMVASAILTALVTKAPAQQKPPDPSLLADFNLPQITEGAPQVVVFGDVWLTDWQVLWYGDLRSDAIHSASGGGGKK